MLIEEEVECSLHFSFPKDSSATIDKNGIKNDWSCPKVRDTVDPNSTVYTCLMFISYNQFSIQCGINNFKRRDECFKCGTSKDDPRTFDKSEVIQPPSNGIAQLKLTQSRSAAPPYHTPSLIVLLTMRYPCFLDSTAAPKSVG